MRLNSEIRLDPREGPVRPGGSEAPFRPDSLRVSLFLFIVVSISTVHAYFGLLRALRLGLTLWVVALALVLLVPRFVDWNNIGKSWPPKAILILVGIACLSAPLGLSLGQSGGFLIDSYLRVAAFYFMLVIAIRGVRDLAFFAWAFVVSSAILGLLALTIMEVAPTFGGDARLASGHMYDANDIGLILLTAIPLGVALFKAFGGWRRWLAAGCLGVMTAAVAMTGSRGAFVGFLFVVPAIFLAMRDVTLPKRTGVVLGFVLMLWVGAPPGYWERIETVFDPADDYNVTDASGRVPLAKRGLGYMMSYPVLGVGIANFPRAEGTISPIARNAMAGDAIRFLAPHNTYIQVGAELGVFALAIWLSLLWLGIAGLRRYRKRLAAGVAAGAGSHPEREFLILMCTYLPVSFIAFATTSFFVSHAYTPVFYVVLAILAGTLALSEGVLRRDRTRSLATSGRGGPPRPASATGTTHGRPLRSRLR